MGLTILIGVFAPIIFGLIHTIIGTYVTLKYSNTLGLFWNGLGFINKTFFLFFMTYLGVMILELNFKIYIPVLTGVWFASHVAEALYSDHVMKNNCSELIDRIQIK